MKNALFSNAISKTLLAAITSTFLITSCTKDESIDESIGLNSSSSSFATPANGNIYTIKDLNSGRTLDIEDKSNSNGANLQLWGRNANTANTHRQWEIINTNDGYVRLRGIDSGKTLEVSEGSNSNGANVHQWTYEGTTHQEWEIISVGDGYFRLKNRDSGKSLTASGGTANGSNVSQYSYIGDNNQKWFFTKVGSIESSNTEEEIVTPVSTPEIIDTQDVIDIDDSNNDFISTNDGIFNLDDFQIESSSHLSSTTSTKTTSWSYNESDIFGSEWYNVIGNDYYLKSAERDGKRTEFKEHPGQESSLNSIKQLKYEASVDDIPENGVTIAQVHNRFNESSSNRSRRPYLRVYIEDGRINVKETTNDLTNNSGTYYTSYGPEYTENSKYKVQITTVSGKVNIKVETSKGTLDEDFTPNTSVDGYNDYKNYFYLKAGVYTEGNDTEPIIRFYSFEDL